MVDLIHEILNDHLIVYQNRINGSMKIIHQEELSKIAEEIAEAIKKEESWSN